MNTGLFANSPALLPLVQATDPGTYTVATNVWQIMSLTVSNIDLTNMHSTLVNPSRIYINVPGKYLFNASVETSTGNSVAMGLGYSINNNGGIQTGFMGTTSAWIAGVLVLKLNKGDYVEFYYTNLSASTTFNAANVTGLFLAP